MGQVIDFLIIAICLFFLIRGYFLGFVSQMLSLLAYIVAYFAAVLFSPYVIEYLQGITNFNDTLLRLMSLSLIFLLAFVVVKIIEIPIVKFTNTSILSGLNRVLGFVFGCFIGIIVIVILDFLLKSQPFFDLEALLGSSNVLGFIRENFLVFHQFVLAIIA